MSNNTRRGNMIVVMTIIVVIMGMAATMVQRSTGDAEASRAREDNERLRIAAESAANVVTSYLRQNPNILSDIAVGSNPAIIADAKPSTLALKPLYGLKLASSDTPSSASNSLKIFNIPITVTYGMSYQGDNGQGTSTTTASGGGGTTTTETATHGYDETFIVRTTARLNNKAYNVDIWLKELPVDTTVTTTTSTIVSYTASRGLGANDGYSFKGSAQTDSWNSAAYASYAAQGTKGTMGDISSNGIVDVQKASAVQGTATSNAGMNMSFSYIEPSAFDSNLGNLNAAATLAAGKVYKASNLGSSTTLTITGSGTVTVYLDGPFSMQNNIVFSGGSTAKLIVYQSNYNSTLGGTTFNGNGSTGVLNDPGRFVLASAYTGDVTLNGNGSWGGVLFAPYANFKLNGTFNYFGSLVTKSMDRGMVNGNFSFHFDEKLKTQKAVDITIPGTPVVSPTSRTYSTGSGQYRTAMRAFAGN